MNKAEYIDHMGDDLRVVNAARMSFNKISQKFEKKDEKLLNYLAKNKHFSPFEHVLFTFEIHCPLYIAQQILRHRTGKYNQVSRRYTSEDLQFYVPNYRKQHKSSKQCSGDDIEVNENYKYQVATQHVHKKCLDLYNQMVDNGIARELARGVLPQNLMTKLIMTMDLRNLANFITLREDSHAQQEVQIIAKQIREACQKYAPISTKALMVN
jgi:thymidylate synthase (FAD)